MDNSSSSADSEDRGLPKAASLTMGDPDAALTKARPGAVVEPNDRAGIFVSLVKDDTDITGLVAYSIYKQNKLDWLRAFEAAKSRAPDDAELSAYIIGEATARRLATYRHLAEATLAGSGPDVEGSAGTARRGPAKGGSRTLQNGLIVTYLLIAVLIVIMLWVAAHLTVASH